MDRTGTMDRSKTVDRLKKRAEFLTVARGDRVSRRGFVLQMGRPAADAPERAARFGFTVTKKNGNSPERNRIRRRLREAVRLGAAAHAVAGTDYVLIGRRAALSQPFDALMTDLISSLNMLARGGSRQAREAKAGLSPGTSEAHAKE